MTGMHYAFIPIAMNNLATKGYDVILPSMFMANLGQAGAAFAVSLRSKNKSFKSLAMTTSLTAVMGITEPAMYGVNMRLKKPFIGGLIGGAVGGAYYSAVGVKYFILGGNVGLPGIASFIGDTFVLAVLGLPIAFAAGAIATYISRASGLRSSRRAECRPWWHCRTRPSARWCRSHPPRCRPG